MQTLKQIVFTGWNFMRWLRLGIGLLFIIEGIQMHDSMIGMIGGLFIFQALANMTCGLGGCSVPATKSRTASTSSTEDAAFEEIK